MTRKRLLFVGAALALFLLVYWECDFTRARFEVFPSQWDEIDNELPSYASGQESRELLFGPVSPNISRVPMVEQTKSISGCFRTTSGRTIAEAAVELFSAEASNLATPLGLGREHRKPIGHGLTSIDGEFRLPAPEGIPLYLRVTAPDHCPHDSGPWASGDYVELTASNSASLRGIAQLENGRPCSGFVTLRMPSQPSYRNTVKIEEGGLFQFTCLSAVEFVIDVDSANGVSKRYSTSARGGVESFVHLVVPIGVMVTGRVVSAETGEIVPGVGIRKSNTSRIAVSSNANGLFELNGCTPDSYEDLHFSASGFASKQVRIYFDSQGTLPVEVVLDPSLKAFGRVTNELNEPLEGVLVGCYRLETEGPDSLQRIDAAEGVTDSDGYYSLTPLRSTGIHTLICAKEGFGTVLREMQFQGSARQLDLGTAVLTEAGTLVVHVQDEKGTPLSGIDITIEGLEEAIGGANLAGLVMKTRSAKASERGSACFAMLRPQRYQLRVRDYLTGRFATRELSIERGKCVRELFTMTNGSEVSGRIVSPNGESVEGCVARVWTSAEEDALFAVASTSGEFTVAISGPGPYYIEVQFTDTRPREFCRSRVIEIVDISKPVVVALPRARTLTGRVYADGSVRPGLTILAIALENPRIIWDRAESGFDGQFKLKVPVQEAVRVAVLGTDCGVTISADQDTCNLELR